MESHLQRKIIRDLKRKGGIPLKIVRCNINGFPDIVWLINKRAVFLEIKDEGEEAEDLQKFRHEELREQGFDVYVVDTWEQYKTLTI